MAEQSRSSALTLRLKLDDKVLSDSIPALYFLPEQYSVEGLV